MSFLKTIIPSGYIILPNFADYWETNSVSGIVKGMSQNHFEQPCSQLLFKDDSLAPAYEAPTENDKLLQN